MLAASTIGLRAPPSTNQASPITPSECGIIPLQTPRTHLVDVASHSGATLAIVCDGHPGIALYIAAPV